MFAKILIRVAGGAVAAAAAVVVVLLGFAFAPTLFGADAKIVTSGSMGDAAPVGSVAVSRLVDSHAISVGDVITFRYAGAQTSITHRVVEITEDESGRVFRTKGDANPAIDPVPVPIRGNIHLLERVVPYAGRIVVFARSPLGGVVLFLLPITGLLLDERRRRRARAAPMPEAPVAHPVRQGPDPDAIVLGAITGIVVAGVVASIGLRPRRASR
ncbi:MAG TPA: signal peptidase I [Actinomycetota bacterium]|nr:signal peptidase I [Actinomycetota bacterium]